MQCSVFKSYKRRCGRSYHEKWKLSQCKIPQLLINQNKNIENFFDLALESNSPQLKCI